MLAEITTRVMLHITSNNPDNKRQRGLGFIDSTEIKAKSLQHKRSWKDALKASSLQPFTFSGRLTTAPALPREDFRLVCTRLTRFFDTDTRPIYIY